MNDTVIHYLHISEEVFTFRWGVSEAKQEIVVLKKEATSLKEELFSVTCVRQGQMKDKFEVLAEMEQLPAVQAEPTTELTASLHTDLGKE